MRSKENAQNERAIWQRRNENVRVLPLSPEYWQKVVKWQVAAVTTAECSELLY